MIVIEGPDACGKSTLAGYLSQVFNYPIQASEGPPKYPHEINSRCARYSQLPTNTIFDRHPAISQRIYSRTLNRPDDLNDSWVEQLYASHPTIIYCDPRHVTFPHALHEAKDHDTEQHLTEITSGYANLVAAYRQWAISHATIIYRIHDPMERIARLCNDFDPVRDIEYFHNHFHVQYNGPPRSLSKDLLKFRIEFMAEELCEYVGVDDTRKKLIQSVLCDHPTTPNLPDEFDSLIDLVYVALGTSYLQGLDFREGWRRVHNANMHKIRARCASDSKRSLYEYDIVKPPDFVPPDFSDLLQR